MLGKLLLILAAALSGPASAIALAAPCEAVFHFDGDLSDSSGNGHDGRMIAPEGMGATPQFVPGRSGQALRLDGESAMRAFIDLHPDTCPQVTISAWINVESVASKRIQNVISTGNGISPGLRVSGTHLLMTGRANGIYARDVNLAGAGWTFVSMVYDYPNSEYRLYWRAREEAKPIGGSPVTPGEAVWIGAFNDRISDAARDILIDDLRIFGRALGAREIAALRTAPAGSDGAVASSKGAVGGSCSAGSACPAGSYCAIDGTCHPESHRPMPDAGTGRGVSGLQEQLAARNAEDTGDLHLDYDSPTGMLDGAGSGEGTLSGLQERLARQSAERTGDIAGDVRTTTPPSLDSADSSSGATQTGAAQEASGPVEGKGSMTAGQFLRQSSYRKEATGNVRDCTAFSEVIGDLATGFRDAVLQLSVESACGFLTTPVHLTAAAAEIPDASGYETMAFREAILEEAYRSCIAPTSAVARLPDKMVAFWNSITGSDTWATIGPRKLEFGRVQSGNLISPGDRKFISASPAMGRDRVFLNLRELEGKARVTARVCRVSLGNHYEKLHTLTVNETPEERDDENQWILQDLGDLHRHFLIVYLDASGTVMRNFRYELKAE